MRDLFTWIRWAKNCKSQTRVGMTKAAQKQKQKLSHIPWTGITTVERNLAMSVYIHYDSTIAALDKHPRETPTHVYKDLATRMCLRASCISVFIHAFICREWQDENMPWNKNSEQSWSLEGREGGEWNWGECFTEDFSYLHTFSLKRKKKNE